MIKPIQGYEAQYTISDRGIVTRIDTGHVLKHFPNVQTGYICIDLWKNNVGTRLYLHRLLAQHFIPNPNQKAEVNHIDGIRDNFDLANLEWVTSAENSYHAVQEGLRVYTNRLSQEEFIEVLDAVIAGESYKALSMRVPYKVPFLSTKVRKIAKELGREEELNVSLQQQKTARNRLALRSINANSTN